MEAYSVKMNDYFKRYKNDVNRPAMENYMKNKFTFLGIKSPERKELLKEFLKLNGSPANIHEMKEIWDLTEREFQYIALELLLREYKRAEKERIFFYETLVIEKSWWDTVDTIAGSLISYHLLKYPELIEDHPEKWITSNNMWLNRVAILFQMKFKEKTDKDRLFNYCKQMSYSKEFFIQKAIGWALREYSYVNPEEVIKFINETDLAPLSKREGLKKIQRDLHK